MPRPPKNKSWLRDLRHAEGLNQVQMAEKLRVSMPYMVKVENDLRPLRKDLEYLANYVCNGCDREKLTEEILSYIDNTSDEDFPYFAAKMKHIMQYGYKSFFADHPLNSEDEKQIQMGKDIS